MTHHQPVQCPGAFAAQQCSSWICETSCEVLDQVDGCLAAPSSCCCLVVMQLGAVGCMSGHICGRSSLLHLGSRHAGKQVTLWCDTENKLLVDCASRALSLHFSPCCAVSSSACGRAVYHTDWWKMIKLVEDMLLSLQVDMCLDVQTITEQLRLQLSSQF